MLETLLGQLKGVLGKTFAFAGLLPAMVLLAGWKLYQTSGTNFPQTVEGVIKGQASAIRVSSWFVLNAFWLGLLFFSSRGLILYFVREVPGWLLSPLRFAMIRRQIRLRSQARRALDEIHWTRTVLKQSMDMFPTDQHTYIPDWARQPDTYEADKMVVEAAANARRIVSELAIESDEVKLPSRRQTRKIVHGLRLLYAASFNPHNGRANVRTEIAEWQALMSGDVKKLIERLDKVVFHSETLIRERFRAYPDEKWVLPTAIGNKLAALDDYAEKRYGIDTSTLWNRLWGILSKQEQQEVNDSQLSIEVLINLSLAFAAMAVGIIVRTLGIAEQPLASARFFPTSIQLPEWSSILFVIVPPIMAFLCYRAAIFAVGGLSGKVMRLVDLRRLQLIGALGFRSPRTVADEKQMFQKLHDFLTVGKPLPNDWWLEPPPPRVDKDEA